MKNGNAAVSGATYRSSPLGLSASAFTFCPRPSAVLAHATTPKFPPPAAEFTHPSGDNPAVPALAASAAVCTTQTGADAMIAAVPTSQARRNVGPKHLMAASIRPTGLTLKWARTPVKLPTLRHVRQGRVQRASDRTCTSRGSACRAATHRGRLGVDRMKSDRPDVSPSGTPWPGGLRIVERAPTGRSYPPGCEDGPAFDIEKRVRAAIERLRRTRPPQRFRSFGLPRRKHPPQSAPC